VENEVNSHLESKNSSIDVFMFVFHLDRMILADFAAFSVWDFMKFRTDGLFPGSWII
jgi:hypothetical protein